ncbi:unnamed protein product [Arabis nemorensis]|uniref:Uncharacterized protein n=1 Tax=Arabis nemorensis TaxID=586526 RepID=A0A565BRX4_9BRAS|nr:unnamed protein product [Arabis nemorensis]
MSQPSSFFSFDSLPPLSLSPFRDSCGFNKNLTPSPFMRCNSTSSRIVGGGGESLPPRKSHRRSNSDNHNSLNSSREKRESVGFWI